MKKSTSKNQIYTGDEMKRYLGALHEEHMARLKAVSDQFIDVNRNEFDALVRRVSVVEKRVLK
ncbi:MAG: hypothetical protein UX89_C0005G0040 [Parcubacteria group bacterium GW2011_GWA2_47_16]|nr:MAG: hypothetical protein UX89_C0005G0040 [Parcubacteria group bacterium GW2011_GWA2_47_16]